MDAPSKITTLTGDVTTAGEDRAQEERVRAIFIMILGKKNLILDEEMYWVCMARFWY